MSHVAGASYDGLGSGFDSIGGRHLFFGSGLGFGGPFGRPLGFFATIDSTFCGIANSSSKSGGTSELVVFTIIDAVSQ